MRISVIRHGETAHNKNRVMQGHGDVPLSAVGIQQARRAAEVLAQDVPDVIYCSDLNRAVMTGTVVAALTGAPLIFDAAFRERNPGALTGKRYDEALSFFTDPVYAPPEGETFAVFSRRIAVAFARLAEAHGESGQHLAVVTHGMIPMAIMHFAFGKTEAECMAMTVANASITTLSYDGAWKLERFADTSHAEATEAGRAGG